MSYNFVLSVVKRNCIVELIPNFVSESEIVNGDREYKEKISDLIYDGGVMAEKGCDVIIEVARELPRINFHLIGSVGPEIKAMEIPANVILYGNKDKSFVQDMLLKSDAFLFLTHFWGEGFSNSLVEAMSAGLPCIVSNWAANADMIGNEEAGGIIVDVVSKNSLKEAIQKISDRDIRVKMGNRNSIVAKDNYTSSVIIPEYTNMYNKLIQSKD